MKRLPVVVAAPLLAWLCATPIAAHPRHHPPGSRSPDASSIQIRLGGFMPEGDSSFWSETESVFTLDAEDFDGFMLGFSFIRPMTNQVELGVNVDFFEETERSAVRDFVDGAGLPILHDTELSMMPVTVDVRFLPGGRFRMRPGGRQIAKPVFYVGAGVGLNFWQYAEFGEFVDFFDTPPSIFIGDFEDDGVAFEAHVLAGVELPVGRTTNFLLEGRYSWSDDDLGGGFGDLTNTDLDLGGRSFFGGVSFRF